MKKGQIGLAAGFLSASLALIPATLSKAEAQAPGLVIAGILRQNPDLKAREISSKSLRLKEKTAATFDTVFCRSFARLKIEQAVWTEKTSVCTLVLAVDSIWVTVEKSMGIVLPSGDHSDGCNRAHAKEILCAHEEGHSLLHERVFFQSL